MAVRRVNDISEKNLINRSIYSIFMKIIYNQIYKTPLNNY